MMDYYKCEICGYIYNPEDGDLSNNIQPGTLFEELPDNWLCPLCEAEKSLFNKL